MRRRALWLLAPALAAALWVAASPRGAVGQSGAVSPSGAVSQSGDASWPGVDEAVVRRVAEEAGQRPGAVFASVQGDLLLFAFLWAGLLCGFALGYTARALFVERLDGDAAPGER